jgi:hypothetical protein
MGSSSASRISPFSKEDDTAAFLHRMRRFVQGGADLFQQNLHIISRRVDLPMYGGSTAEDRFAVSDRLSIQVDRWFSRLTLRSARLNAPAEYHEDDDSSEISSRYTIFPWRPVPCS